jgi:hypothetical protein
MPVRKDFHIPDIGASIGIYARHLAELVGDSGRVISVEPVQETFSYLANTVASPWRITKDSLHRNSNLPRSGSLDCSGPQLQPTAGTTCGSREVVKEHDIPQP